jgi:hypothetical protein
MSQNGFESDIDVERPVNFASGQDSDLIVAVKNALLLFRQFGFLSSVRASFVAVAVFVFSYAIKPEYRATMKVIPYRSAAPASGLSSLAGLAGFRLPNGVMDQTISEDMYPTVIRSLDFQRKLAEMPLVFQGESELISALDYFQRPTNQSLIVRFTSALSNVPSYTLELLRGSPPVYESKVGGGNVKLESLDREYVAAVKAIGGRVSLATDKKTFVLDVSATMPDPYAAADIVRSAVSLLAAEIIRYETSKARDQLDYLLRELESARGRLALADRRLADFADRNRAVSSEVALVERRRLQDEYDLAFEVFRQFSREVEQAKIKVNQDLPVFATLENVTVPSVRAKPHRVQMAFRAFFVSLALMMIFQWWRNQRSSVR